MTLHKVRSIASKFKWLNIYDNVPNFRTIGIWSNKESKNQNEFLILLEDLFKDDYDNILIGPSSPDGCWAEFWGFFDFDEVEIIEYSIFIEMLKESKIDSSFRGFCKILDWKKLLKLISDVIFNIGGAESLFFYNEKAEYVFYPHHTFSIGIYYVNMSENLKIIIDKAEKLGCEIKFVN